jgi:dimethylglycine dehydrogenase
MPWLNNALERMPILADLGIKRVVHGHRVQKSLAFAFVKPEHAAPGTGLEVLLLDGKVPALVLAESVYDPGSELPRSG